MKTVSKNLDFPSRWNFISSIFFNDDFSPLREVVSRSNTKATGKWPSWKMGTVRYESENEKNAFKLLDASPEVIKYYPQPCMIRYQLNGESHIHYPDILVVYKDRKELWEVKTLNDSLTPEVSNRSNFMSDHLAEHGYVYRVAIAENLKLNPRLKNIELLIAKGRDKVDLHRRELIRQIFRKFSIVSWSFFQNLPSHSIQLKHICRLILEGELVCDISQPIQSSTVIKLNQNQQGDQLWVSHIL